MTNMPVSSPSMPFMKKRLMYSLDGLRPEINGFDQIFKNHITDGIK